jgi:hypothetical protein
VHCTDSIVCCGPLEVVRLCGTFGDPSDSIVPSLVGSLESSILLNPAMEVALAVGSRACML